MLLCFCSSPSLLQKQVLFREEYKLVLVHLQDNYWFIILYLKLAQSQIYRMCGGGRGVEFKQIIM